MNGLVQRVVNLLKAPGKEWPVIAGEPSTIQSLFVPYALILAAIGPVAMLLGGGAWGGVCLAADSCCAWPSPAMPYR